MRVTTTQPAAPRPDLRQLVGLDPGRRSYEARVNETLELLQRAIAQHGRVVVAEAVARASRALSLGL